MQGRLAPLASISASLSAWQMFASPLPPCDRMLDRVCKTGIASGVGQRGARALPSLVVIIAIEVSPLWESVLKTRSGVAVMVDGCIHSVCALRLEMLGINSVRAASSLASTL